MQGDDGRDSVRIKIRGTEFESTGSEEAVNARFEKFMDFADRLAKEPSESIQDKPPPPGGGGGNDDPAEILRKRAFQLKDDVVSLNVLPQGDTQGIDAVILLLYGRHHLVEDGPTLIDVLLKGLQQSGLQLGAVSKIVAGNEALITKAGIKRGTRYGLTNKGMQRAEEVLRKLL